MELEFHQAIDCAENPIHTDLIKNYCCIPRPLSVFDSVGLIVRAQEHELEGLVVAPAAIRAGHELIVPLFSAGPDKEVNWATYMEDPLQTLFFYALILANPTHLSLRNTSAYIYIVVTARKERRRGEKCQMCVPVKALYNPYIIEKPTYAYCAGMPQFGGTAPKNLNTQAELRDFLAEEIEEESRYTLQLTALYDFAFYSKDGMYFYYTTKQLWRDMGKEWPPDDGLPADQREMNRIVRVDTLSFRNLNNEAIIDQLIAQTAEHPCGWTGGFSGIAHS